MALAVSPGGRTSFRKITLAIGSDLLFFAVCLSLLLAIVYWRELFAGQTFFTFGDHPRFTIPIRAQLADALRAGRVPEWWDGVELGVNVAAIPSYQSAYLPAWIVAIFGAASGTDLVLLIHLLVGGIGLALWATRLRASRCAALVGGALFMLGGYMSSMTVLHAAEMSPAWIPWIAWSADRLGVSASTAKWKALLGPAAASAMFISLVTMAGDPSAAISGSLVGLLVVGARSERRGRAVVAELGAISFAVLMSAAVLLPAALNLPETDRTSDLGSNNAVAWSLHPLSLLELLWPHALGDATNASSNLARVVADTAHGTPREPAYAYSIYFGWVATGIAVCGAFSKVRGARILAIGSLSFLLLALGTYTPVYAGFRALFFPERWLRYPARYFSAVVVLWSVLAAVGFDVALREVSRRYARLAVAISLAILVTTEIVVCTYGIPLVSGLVERAPALSPPVQASGVTHEIAVGGAFTIVELIIFAAALFATRRPRVSWSAQPLAALAIAVPLANHAYTLIPRASRDAVTADAGILGGLAHEVRSDAARPRLWSDGRFSLPSQASYEPQELAAAMGQTAMENLGGLHGFAHFPGYSPALMSSRLNTVLEASKNGHRLRLMELFDVDYTVTSAIAPLTGSELVLSDPVHSVVVLRATSARQRAFVAGRWARLAGDEAIIHSMLSPSADLNLVRIAIAGDSEFSTTAAGSGTGGPCDLHTSRPERVDLRCSSPGGGYAVLADAWAPGWSATVDGTPAVVERADMLLRAVRVGPGEHNVAFEYRAPGLRTGACVSLLAWLAAGVLLSIRARRSEVADARPPRRRDGA